jgi:hypothetical protein
VVQLAFDEHPANAVTARTAIASPTPSLPTVPTVALLPLPTLALPIRMPMLLPLTQSPLTMPATPLNSRSSLNVWHTR